MGSRKMLVAGKRFRRARFKPMLASNSGLHCWNVLDKHGRSSCREGKSHRMEGQVVESVLEGKSRVGSGSGSEEVVSRHRAGAPYLFLHIATATEAAAACMAPGWWASIVQDRGSAAPGQTTELRRLVHVWRRAWRALARLPSFPRQTNSH